MERVNTMFWLIAQSLTIYLYSAAADLGLHCLAMSDKASEPLFVRFLPR